MKTVEEKIAIMRELVEQMSIALMKAKTFIQTHKFHLSKVTDCNNVLLEIRKVEDMMNENFNPNVIQ